jgi:hypothetical protein
MGFALHASKHIRSSADWFTSCGEQHKETSHCLLLLPCTRRQLSNGNLEVGVHIADVTHFLLPDTAMDLEAASRATTTYLVQRRIDMLPKPLTEDICSLRWVGDVGLLSWATMAVGVRPPSAWCNGASTCCQSRSRRTSAVCGTSLVSRKVVRLPAQVTHVAANVRCGRDVRACKPGVPLLLMQTRSAVAHTAYSSLGACVGLAPAGGVLSGWRSAPFGR